MFIKHLSIALVALSTWGEMQNNFLNPNFEIRKAQISCNYLLLYQDTLRTSGEREYKDSSHFSITRGWYKSGAKFIEVFDNHQTRLDNWKEWYENGQLRKMGKMTNGNHIYVGIWNYYAPDGRLDSMVDYEKKYQVAYFAALKIASGQGYKMPHIEMEITDNKGKKYWQVARWHEKPDHTGQDAEVILIDTETGAVSKPSYRLSSVY